ncbi:MAG: TetR/AcrR family transcriptional regulator [Acidimicrobiales bacterium]
MAGSDTKRRILDAALTAFGGEGYAATSLDDLAHRLGVRKQTILYWFPSKSVLFQAVIDDAAVDLVTAFDEAATTGLSGLDQVEAIVRRVFRLAVGQPELLGLVREVSRPGSLSAARLAERVRPLFERARDFLAREMAAGRLRESQPDMLLLSLYSTVVGVTTELEVQRAIGLEPTLRSTVRRRQELVRFLRAALAPLPG